MAEYTYEQLKGMTVAELRDIAKGIHDPSLEGYSTWHKEHLLPELCKVLHIPTHHVAAGQEKLRLKTAIRAAKVHRDEPSAKDNLSRQAFARQIIHAAKRRLRKLAEAK